MIGPLLALFQRSVREHLRSGMTSLMHGGLVCVVLLFLLMAHAQSWWSGAVGLQLFQQITTVNVVFITLAGLSYFASAITEEKEVMALPLLRMTDLSAA